MNRIGLGTVQLGMDYGITNTIGKVSADEADSIIKKAICAGITLFDTAPGYGDSESVLGNVTDGIENISIITKLDRLDFYRKDTIEMMVENNIKKSLERLKKKSIYGLLIHDPGILIGEHGELLWESMESIKNRNLVKRVGVSVYETDMLDLIVSKYPVDIVQLPFNILNQKFLKEGCLSRLKSKNIEIHARSIFLQGLLIADPDSLSYEFSGLKQTIENFHRLARQLDQTPVELALNFVLNHSEIDHAIVGVTSLNELNEILNMKQNYTSFDYASFAIDDDRLINPIYWSNSWN